MEQRVCKLGDDLLVLQQLQNQEHMGDVLVGDNGCNLLEGDVLEGDLQ